MRIRDDYRSLTGQEKAAIILLSLGEEVAAKLFALMGDEEIKELSQTMAGLGTVNSSIIERLIVEFADQLSATGSLMGTFDSTERLLSKVLDKNRMAEIMDDIRGPAGRTMWDKLGNVNEGVLGNYLKNEYPQTVSVILSKIRSDHAARVLSTLPEAFAMEVVMRMLRMETVQKDVLDDIERVLRNEFMSNLAKTNRKDTHEMMAEIFNSLDRQTEARFTVALEERNRDSAEKIKALMFKFEDLSKLDPSGVQTLLRAIDKSKLAVALKGAKEELRDLFLSNMSERAGKMLKEEIEALGPVRGKDVAEAQTAMVNTAKELAAKDEIVISKGAGGEDDLIY
ncbi:MAG: flagellar motor switch protein FliG [Magnetospirillum sp.]|jgi:flagellar motor switch protein FliG|nr:flagellar motor switch protein FliG [Magnetospirillum sp.]